MASTIMESLFQRTLEDLVKGLRVQVIGEARYIAEHLEEIRKEIKSTDAHTKAVALEKLTYVNLHGVDMEWAAFHVIEVMSMTKLAHKKIGYLAASQSFHDGIDVILLITNQLRKDMASTSELEAGLALECLSCIATPDLARELTPEVFTLLASGRLNIRKKATLVLLKLFSKNPDGVRIAFKRLVEKMEDNDVQVVSAAVSVLCEMAKNDPSSYLPLAPEFYRLLVDSKNNWLTIKVVKIFGVLTPLEPRLGRKIAEPLCEHMRRTGAKSLLIECIRTVIAGLTDHAGAMKLAVEKLKEVLKEDDPNLIYLGLQGLAALMPAHPWAVAENKSIIIRGLSDEDHSIQMASLQLIMGMVSHTNLIETVQILMQYARKSDPSFCNELIDAILVICSRGVYELIPDFAWYVTVLGDLARISESAHATELERQFVDIGMRVKEIRGDLVHVARGILLDPTLLEYPSLDRVLSALAWIAGEYIEFSQNPYELIEALLQPRTKLLSPPVQAVYLQAVLKAFVYFSFLCLKGALLPTEGKRLTGTFSSLDLGEKGTRQELETDLDLNSADNRQGELSSQEQCVDILMSSDDGCDRGSTSTSMDGLQGSNSQPPGGFILTEMQQESLDRIMKLVDLNVGPLAQSVHVEVQERACNLLGIVKAFKESLVPCRGSANLPKMPQKYLQKALEMIKFLRGLFSEELGPVSVFAQGRLAVPDGLILEENLDGLDALVSDEEVYTKDLVWRPEARAWEDGPIFVQRSEDVLQSGESASLLAQHRQSHGAYYLSTGKELAKDDQYPPLQIVQSDIPSSSPASEDIMKLAEQSLLWTTKPLRGKARPVVVRLDDAEEVVIQSVKSKKDLKDDFISSAIRDVLAGDKNRLSSMSSASKFKESVLLGSSNHSSHHHHRKSHRRLHEQNSRAQTDGKPFSEIYAASVAVGEAVELDDVRAEGTPGKRRHSKHRKKLSKELNMSEREQGSKGNMQEINSGEHQKLGRRSRQTMKSPVKVHFQTPVIPDFLL